MEKLIQRQEFMFQALDSLSLAMGAYQKGLDLANDPEWREKAFTSAEETERTFRDSMIQRFEFSSDLFWKFLKEYLEKIELVQLESKGPKGIFRDACRIGIIGEKETETALKMIDDRNMTSHIYKEEIAQHISKNIPAYYDLMLSIAQRLDKKIK
jgi:nucleotidyltransferase substrate binding protein (TIGR01987 family)